MKIFNDYIETCHHLLLQNPDALNYLYSRHVRLEDIYKFKLGFSPNNWEIPLEEPLQEDFYRHFPKTKYFLVNKIVIPVFNPEGVLSGLTVRTFGNSKKFYRKWLSHKALPHWGLYGFFPNKERILKEKKVFVVESFFDMIAVLPWVPYVISSQTAFLCKYQLAFLKRYVDHIVFAYNNDYNKDFNTGKVLMKELKETCRELGLVTSSCKLPDKVNDFSDFRTLNPDLSEFFRMNL